MRGSSASGTPWKAARRPSRSTRTGLPPFQVDVIGQQAEEMMTAMGTERDIGISGETLVKSSPQPVEQCFGIMLRLTLHMLAGNRLQRVVQDNPLRLQGQFEACQRP